ncbi:DUF7094 domain-containing protein [Halodesulfurarchaeum sp.]|uniref:DUF7094 domain-containing protein n=1 Tax=Halodesulfurarchaeum sp. TaxID=1980530 RepID=UPI002FC30752
MTRPLRSVLLALLVLGVGASLAVGAGPAGAATSGQVHPSVEDPSVFQPVEVGPNTTRSLTLDTVEESAITAGSVSVTDAMQAESGAVEAILDSHAVQNRLAANDPDRERVLREALDRNADRVEELAHREQVARDRYRTSEIGPETYLSTVGQVNQEANALENTLRTYEALAEDHPALQDRVAAQQTDTLRYTGPVAGEIGTAVTGGDPTGDIFVSVGENGVALSAIRDGTYNREVMRTDARDDAVGGVDLDAAQSRIAELYPWAWENKGDVSINTVGQDVFRFQLSHGHGVLNSLLDTSSGNVYREVQEKSLSSLPVMSGPSTTVNNSTLQMSEPRPGSPLRVQVVNQTGVSEPATIQVEGSPIGTADESPVWLLTPPTSFNVTAETGTETLELGVQPE